jgi:hypothetical protein
MKRWYEIHLKVPKKALITFVIAASLVSNTSSASAWPWNGSAAEQQMKKEAAAAYKRITSDCYNISGYSKIKTIGSARSDQRITAANNFYIPLVEKLCLKNSKGQVFENPYYGINLSKIVSAKYSTYDYELFQSILFNVDYGFSPFTSSGTICGDGTISNSVGSGTCSWHGGYAKPRGTEVSFEEYREFKAPVADEYSKVSSMGFDWQNGGTWTEMRTPVENIKSGTTGFNCVTSSGFAQNCFHQPHYSFNFCSSDKSGTVQLLVGKEWMTAWSTYGFKIMNNCPKDTPYLFEVNGTSVLTGDMRVLFPDKTFINYRVNAGKA